MELLQVDPEYTPNAALKHKASIRSIDPIPATIKWNLVAVEFVDNRFLEPMQWKRVLDACRVLLKILEKHCENIRPGTLLSPEVGTAMRSYSNPIKKATGFQRYLFGDAIMHMSALKEYCYAVVKADGKI
jgi:hypothetical protein